MTLSSSANPTGKPRLAVVTETWPPEINGVAMTLHHFVTRLRSCYRVQLIRPQQLGPVAELDGVEQQPVPGFRIPFYREVRLGYPAKNRLLTLWRHQPPDLVQIVTEGPLGWSALRVAKQLGIPIISEFHTNFHQYSKYYHAAFLLPMIERYLRWFHNQSQLTLVPTQRLKQSLQARGYQAVEVVTRGVDIVQYGPHHRKPALRQAWGAADSQLVVIHVGRLAPEKNLGLAIRAFRAIQQHRPDALMVMVGDGPSRASLQAANPDMVFTGMQRGTDLAQHYASGDLFLAPSITETFGNIILEAMASQLGLVCFDYAAATEHIRHQHHALSVPLHDESAFIQAAVDLAQQEALRLQMAAAARQVACNLSWDGICHRFDQLVQRLITHEESEYDNPFAPAESG